MAYKILFTAPYMIPFIDKFRPIFEHYQLELIVPHVEERMESDDLLAFAGEFDGTICGDDRYTPEVIQACAPRLKVISKWGTGIDSIDKTACDELNIKIGNTPNAFTYPVADSIMGYILAFARNHSWMDKAMKAGEWKKISGHSLKEATLGLVGLGNIGKAVAKRAIGFEMNCIATEIIDIPEEILNELKMTLVSKEELFANSDYLCLACDLNPTSRNIVNTETLSQMKSSAVVINTARGPLVDEKALIKSLQSDNLRGAAMDVFEHEPLPSDSPLKEMDNVMLAPHNSNSSPEAWENVHWNTIKNLLIGLEISTENLGPHLLSKYD